MTLSYSTATVDDVSQLDYWRDVVCATFVQLELEPPPQRSGRFRGQVIAQDLDCVQIATVTADPHSVVRTPAAIRRSQEDDFFVNLAVRGHLTLAQDGREAHLHPGDFTVYDSARPCRISGLGRPFELIVVKVPRDAFLAQCPLPRDATATVVHGNRGTGALLGPFLEALTVHAAGLPQQFVPRVGGNVLDLLGTALAERAGTMSARPPRPGQLQRARRYILNHLGEPTLSPSVIASALGVSVRYLQGIFHAEGTSPFRWVQEQRLERAARLLADPGQASLSITDIAFGVGFTDTSHFTRAFRKRYGTSPRDYRRTHTR